MGFEPDGAGACRPSGAAVVQTGEPRAPTRLPASTTPDGAEFCEPTNSYLPAEDCERERVIIGGQPLGVASLAAEPKMRLKKTYPVKLIVGTKERQQQNQAVLEPFGEVSSGDLVLGPWICAELSATNFTLSGENPTCQRRGSSPQVSFEWAVTPVAAGRHRLSATVQSKTERDGEPFEQIDSNHLSIDVEADVGSRFEEASATGSKVLDAIGGFFGSLTGLLTAIAGLLAALGVVIWRWKQLGSRPEAPVNLPEQP